MVDQLTRAKRSHWNMKQRCLNRNNPRYHQYGGRGITVCDRWRDSFQNFLDDMGLPKGRDTIDRIDNNGIYEPNNCRWADYKTQAANQRRGGTTKENAERTHCIHGHELKGDNVRITYRGRRECRPCHLRRSQEHKARKRAAALAQQEPRHDALADGESASA